jgi:nucleoside-diphosphate-sugar epimerase
VARILIVGGGCRGRALAASLVADGHAVRITTRTEAGRAAIEASGAECWIGTPDRLATLRGSLENVTVLCWILGSATGTAEELHALHGPRLEFFATQAIDTTVRGFVYEAGAGAAGAGTARAGMEVVREIAQRNAIPIAFLSSDAGGVEAWCREARTAIASLIGA